MSGGPEQETFEPAEFERFLEEAEAALRRPDLAETSPASLDGVVGRALLLLRRGREAESLGAQLRDFGLRTTVARHAFTALDYLRWQRHDLVVSDFALWADDGRLLFERMRSRNEAVPVIFITEGDGDSGPRAKRAGALAVISRPLQAPDVEAAVRLALPRNAPGDARPSASRGGSRRATPAEDVSPPAESERLEPAAEPGDETPWLRFFFEVRRRLRGLGDPAIRQARLLGCLREVVGCPVALIAEPAPSGVRLIFDESFVERFRNVVLPEVELRRAASRRSSDTSMSLFGELFETLVHGEDRRQRPGAVRLGYRLARGDHGALLIHFGRRVPEGLSPFFRELRILLALIARHAQGGRRGPVDAEEGA